MRYLNPWDYVAIVGYFAVMIGIGLAMSRRGSKSLEHYFLGGHKLPWWAMGMSGMAASFDVTGTMLIVSFLYMVGPQGIYIEFRGGACLVLAFMMVFTGKWHRRSGCMTGAEWMAFRFGEGPGGQFARMLQAAATIVFALGMLAYLIKGVGLFFSMFLPFSPLTCQLIVIGVATTYTLASGFYGVVVIDVVQTVIILLGVGVITSLAVSHVGEVGSVDDLAHQVVGAVHWTSAAPSRHVEMLKGYEAYESLRTFMLFYLVKTIIGGFGTGADPRYFGARNERECGLLTFLWSSLVSLRWPMMIGFAVLGLLLVRDFFPEQSVLAEAADLIRQYEGNVSKERWEDVTASIMHSPQKHAPELVAGLQSLLEGDWKSKLHFVSHEGTVNPERILPAVLLHRIPFGLRGLLLVAMFAAAMSTYDSTVNTATGFFTRDLYQRFCRPRAGHRELLGASYAFGIVLVSLSLAMAAKTRDINHIWGWIIMSLTSGLAIPGILRLYWWRFNAGGVVASSLVGLTLPLLQRVLLPDLDERLQFVGMTGVALAAAIVGTFLSSPTDPRILGHFYRTTRPFGLWGPLKRTLPPEIREPMTREHRNDILAVPCAMIWQVSLFIMWMQLVVRAWDEIVYSIPLFATAGVGLYYFWYGNLPPAEPSAPIPEPPAEHLAPDDKVDDVELTPVA